ncbi:hybrid sensor histidine kinase/response regulator [Paludisphaera mucosa]|uniref:histidine kinase n=1 Tax=Paludisphaera mucosa TaxID=3030827 RepID=A0ABT6F431_9BACT|nr:ATP-binding protein [Paludisphaera mucosa]MDG3002267.1 ATP-binding protein [Paludisphaera mucosa]
MNEPADVLAERVLLIPPTARDADASAAILRGVGVACVVCRDVAHLCEEAGRGAAAAVLTQEALLSDRAGSVASLLKAQPPWSDLPLIVLVPAGLESPRSLAAIRDVGHTTLVKRPLQRSTFVSTVASALRDRRRQYQARDLLREQARQSELLRGARDALAFALEAGRLGSWELDVATGDIPCSPICKRNFGLPADAALTHARLFELIHPDDRGHVDRALRDSIENGAEYLVEHRILWDDGSVHWVQVRGRTSYDACGKAVRLAGMSLDVTERRRGEEALRTSVARLEEEDRRKDEFLAMLAHELRNPLAAISSATQVAKRGRAKEQLDWGLDVIERQGRHLSRMIDDLLDASRITRGVIDLHREPVDLAPILRSAVETARPLIDQKQHAISVQIDAGRMGVEGDATRLEQVFVNLLNNAAKYTDAGGRLSLSARAEGGRVVVRVRDTGMGMTPEFLARAFDLFVQGDRSAARSEGGLGIGLTLVKSLVEMHGGSVAASSAGPGLGSEFAVRLPLVRAEPEADAGREAAGPDVGRKLSVLVVDDNADTAWTTALSLELLGHVAAVAHDGPAALEAARSARPEVVLLDIGLPGMDGHQVARALRGDGFSDTLIVALSGYGRDEDRERSRAAGFDHHLVKPVDLDALAALLRDAP